MVFNLSCKLESLGSLKNSWYPYSTPEHLTELAWDEVCTSGIFQSSQVVFRGCKGWRPAFCLTVLAAGNCRGKHLFHLSWTLQIEFSERTLFSECAFVIWAYLQIVSLNLIKKGTSFYGKFSVRRCWCVILGHERKSLLITRE